MNEMPVSPEAPKNNNTTIMIVAAVVLVLCCCCCAFLVIGWYSGDYVIQAINGG